MKKLACTLLIAAACGGDSSSKHSLSGTISVGNQARTTNDDIEIDDGAEFVSGELIVTFRSTSRRMIATRIALPDMELEPSEVGHPTWGPAFRTVKAKR